MGSGAHLFLPFFAGGLVKEDVTGVVGAGVVGGVCVGPLGC